MYLCNDTAFFSPFATLVFHAPLDPPRFFFLLVPNLHIHVYALIFKTFNILLVHLPSEELESAALVSDMQQSVSAQV